MERDCGWRNARKQKTKSEDDVFDDRFLIEPYFLSGMECVRAHDRCEALVRARGDAGRTERGWSKEQVFEEL